MIFFIVVFIFTSATIYVVTYDGDNHDPAFLPAVEVEIYHSNHQEEGSVFTMTTSSIDYGGNP